MDANNDTPVNSDIFTSSVGAIKPQIDHLVFNCSSMRDLAQEVASGCREWMRAGSIEWKSFEDGCPNIFLTEISKIRGRHVLFLADFFRPADIFAQLSVLFALPRYCCTSLTVVLPYFPTGTMERVDTEGQIATAHSLAKMLCAIPPTAHGPTRLVIYDIHALQERFFFDGGITPVLETAIPTLIQTLKQRNEEVVICFPDDGAQKRFQTCFLKAGFECIVCSKIRDGDKRVVVIRDGDCEGKTVLVVDDLVRTGGTLLECRKALIRAGAAKTMCFCTHAIFPDKSYKRFIQDEQGSNKDTFDVFFVTNSCPQMSNKLKGRKPFEVLSIGSSLLRFIETSRDLL